MRTLRNEPHLIVCRYVTRLAFAMPTDFSGNVPKVKAVGATILSAKMGDLI